MNWCSDYTEKREYLQLPAHRQYWILTAFGKYYSGIEFVIKAWSELNGLDLASADFSTTLADGHNAENV